MQCLLEDAADEMKLREEDKEWLRGEITSQIRERLYPKGWKKITRWLRDWGLAGAAVGAFFALAAIAVALAVVAFNRVGNDAAFQTRTEDIEKQANRRLDKIEGQLDRLSSQFAAAELTRLSQLKPSRLATGLDNLQRLTEHPPRGFQPNRMALQTLAVNLAQVNKETPEYWPTVLRFIEFASSALVPPSDVPPPGVPFSSFTDSGCISVAPGQHCLSASHQAIVLDGGSFPNSVFDHCRIKFTNNPVNLAGSVFIDCVFEMPTTVQKPSPYLKRAAMTLLAGNLDRVKFPAS